MLHQRKPQPCTGAAAAVMHLVIPVDLSGASCTGILSPTPTGAQRGAPG